MCSNRSIEIRSAVELGGVRYYKLIDPTPLTLLHRHFSSNLKQDSTPHSNHRTPKGTAMEGETASKIALSIATIRHHSGVGEESELNPQLVEITQGFAEAARQV